MIKRRGSSRPLLIGIVVVLLAVIGFGLGFKVLVDMTVKKAADRQAEKKSLQGMMDAASKMAEGKPVEGQVQFPDTPIGHMNKSLYAMMEGEQARGQKFTNDLDGIGWSWVMTDESLSSKANLQECLVRIGKAKKIVTSYSDGFEGAWSEMMKSMEAEATSSSEAREFLVGFKGGANKKGSGLFYPREIIRELRVNHAALEELIQFLIEHDGQYQMQSGAPVFSARVADSVLDHYNDISKRVNDSLKRINDLDAERQKQAEQGIQRARESLK